MAGLTLGQFHTLLHFLQLFLIVLPGINKKRNKTIALPTVLDAILDVYFAGILAQESDSEQIKYGLYYIEKAYVDYLGMAGSHAVPILPHQSDEYYKRIFAQINGILLPGGGVNLHSSGYAEAATKLVQLAMKRNDEGIYFPVWGTCLGFEMLVTLAADKQPVLTKVDAMDYQQPLTLTKG